MAHRHRNGRRNHPTVRGIKRHHRKRVPADIRRAVWERDGFYCRYCGVGDGGREIRMTLDHVVPVSHGGVNTLDNLVTSCEPCNKLLKAHHFDSFKARKVWISQKIAGSK